MNDSQTDSTAEQLRSYMEEKFAFQFDGEQITPETDLFYEGIIDSFAIVDLVTYIESNFEITLTDNDMTSPLLSTLAGMSQLITERRSAGA